ncbi:MULTISPECIES: spike base protein, RCAP_Rcc01079 family [Haematobacter]|uniref:Uncharacterized protein n=1 Tax=Haematobacter genomosp. 1 TaxID=366618 RepID=A0A212AC57_9RHOB|nr:MULTISPECIES: hypothetical protein [Haematobacter]OWJ78457.1 hypothetical protein CDV49_08450 [Haematobacter genomosp. 1]
MTQNLFASQAPGLTAPLLHIFDILPGEPLAYVTRAILLAEEGTVTLTTLGGETVTTLPLAPGVWHPVMATAVGAASVRIQGGC